jgi:HSP20 family molecular chaperone IbpA
MLYTNSLSRMLDEVFTFPYHTRVLEDSFVYDSVKADKDGTTKIDVVVPGYSKEDLKLEMTDNVLKLWSDLENKKFVRQWKLSDSIDPKKIKADCKNGILSITLQPRDKKDKTLSIAIG